MALSTSGVTIPTTGSGDATPVVAADPAGPGGSYAQTMDIVARIANYLEIIACNLGVSAEYNTGRLRVVLDTIGGAQTLGTVTAVTTVSTLTNVAQIGGITTNSSVMDQMQNCWANSVRRNIT